MKEGNAKISGILSIVSGSIGVLCFILFIFIALVVALIPQSAFGMQGDQKDFILIMQIMYGVLGVFCLILGILGIVGGIYAIKRKYWGLALAAGIAGILIFFPTGIPAVIYAAMGRKEFLPQQVEIPPTH